MMEADIIHLANILRPLSREIFSGKGKLCLSSSYLNKLNAAVDSHVNEDIPSFQIVQTSNTKTNLIRDTQFLLDLINKTVSLKVSPDETVLNTTVDISNFTNIKSLEIVKLDVNIILGLQKLRSQIQELSCSRSLKYISDVLEKCGGDKSQPYSWNELRIANFAHNEIIEIDNSFECTLSLHTLDLSHNNLSKANFINLLPNLKYLNLAFNKLDVAPYFNGQIKSRLQILVLNNNFIEDLSGISSVVNLQQLDLGQNCLLDHKSLLSISHLVSLQWLNLQGNPLSFHRQHRQLVCNYLNKNASSLRFLLNGVILNKNEKLLTGSLYPLSQTIQTSYSSNNSLESSVCSFPEKPRKIRNVTIEEAVDVDEDVVKVVEIVSTPSTPSQHLEIKRQVEELRKEYGESWLYRHSGMIVQDVLGFDKNHVISSTPNESTVENFCIASPNILVVSESTDFNTATNESQNENEVFCTAEDTIFSNTQDDKEVSDASDGEDVFSGGEDCMFLATNTGDGIEVFVVVTDSHISERDVTTSKERARWHINTVISCEKNVDDENTVTIEFDTLRRDRKQRIFELTPGERETFYVCIKEKVDKVLKTEHKKLVYQCMKCSEIFHRSKNALLDQPTIVCPTCSSNMVVETV